MSLTNHPLLVGKTIAKVEHLHDGEHDDDGWLRLTFSDGTQCVIQADFGGYTGDSLDEYPTRLVIYADPLPTMQVKP